MKKNKAVILSIFASIILILSCSTVYAKEREKVFFQKIVYGNNVFCAIVDDNGKGSIKSSKDGKTWTDRIKNARSLYCLIWDGKQFTAGGLDKGILYTSKDGVSWSKIKTGLNGGYTNLAMISNKYYINSESGLNVSADLKSWKKCGNNNLGAWTITGNGNNLIATTYNTTKYTKDGTQWNDIKGLEGIGNLSFSWSNGRFTAKGMKIVSKSADSITYSGTVLCTSEDGQNWSIKDISDISDYITFIGNTYYSYSNYQGSVFSSKDGLIWDQRLEHLDCGTCLVPKGNELLCFGTSGKLVGKYDNNGKLLASYTNLSGGKIYDGMISSFGGYLKIKEAGGQITSVTDILGNYIFGIEYNRGLLRSFYTGGYRTYFDFNGKPAAIAPSSVNINDALPQKVLDGSFDFGYAAYSSSMAIYLRGERFEKMTVEQFKKILGNTVISDDKAQEILNSVDTSFATLGMIIGYEKSETDGKLYAACIITNPRTINSITKMIDGKVFYLSTDSKGIEKPAVKK